MEDEGEGFNYEPVLKRATSLATGNQIPLEDQLEGLGLLIITECVDRVQFNDGGNQIPLTKWLKPKR